MLFMKVEMFGTQKSTMPLSFSNFDFFADLQGRFGRFANLLLSGSVKWETFFSIQFYIGRVGL